MDSLAINEGDEEMEERMQQEVSDNIECKEEMQTLLKLARENKAQQAKLDIEDF